MRNLRLNYCTIIICAIMLVILATATGSAATGPPKKMTRLGGPSAFFKSVPSLMNIEDVKKMVQKYKADITRLLNESGWYGKPEDFFAAIEAGRYVEIEFPVGGEFEWIMYRKNGLATLGPNRVWAGSAPFPAYRLLVEVNDQENCQDLVYEFIIPRECGNIGLTGVDTRGYEAEVKAALSLSPDQGCVCDDSILDASGTSATLKGQSVLAEITGKVRLPDGTTRELDQLAYIDSPRWDLNFDKPGQYRFTVVAKADDCEGTTAQASVVYTANECKPVCNLEVGPARVYSNEPIEVSASGSGSQTGRLEKVEVKVFYGEEQIDSLELKGDLKTTVRYKQPGQYTFMGLAVDQCGQESIEDCQGQVTVLSRWSLFFTALAGKESRFRPSLGTVWEEPLLIFKAGVSYMARPDKLELAGAIGYSYAVDTNDFDSVFGDLYFNYLAKPYFIGMGVGVWDISHPDTDTFDLIFHGGFDLPWLINNKAVQFKAEARVFFKHRLANVENNYLVSLGLRFNF
jgi:hypothetical protein